MSYIDSGRQQGATVHLGGGRIGNEGYFIQVPPLVFPLYRIGTYPSICTV